MTEQQFKEKLKIDLAFCSYPNDGSIEDKINTAIQWAWDNWHDALTKPHWQFDYKSPTYTDSFRDEWIDDHSFDMEAITDGAFVII